VSAQEEILGTPWGRTIVRARVAALPDAPAGFRVQEPSDDGVEDEDEGEDDEEREPVATGTTTTTTATITQVAARPTVRVRGGPSPTPDLLANTSIERTTTGSTAQRFPADGAASDDEDDEGKDGGEGDETTFEARQLLASEVCCRG